jgi:predicted MFS family arabinose efflux permease
MTFQLLALCFGNFIIGTGTMIVPGMLPALAEGLNVSLPVAGQLVTVFAVSIGITAPILSGATSRYDRRLLLVGIMLLYFVGHLVSALISSHTVMMVVRAITAISAGLYVAQAASAAALLVPSEDRGRTMAFVFLGWSIAAVFGLPAGAYVGATLGWRTGFGLVAAGCLISTIWLWFALPAGLRVTPIDRAMWGRLFRHPSVLLVASVTIFITAGQFVIFPYFVAGAIALVQATPLKVSILLATYGVFGLAGNLVSGRLCDRLGAQRVVMGMLAFLMASQFIWTSSQGVYMLMALSMAVLGIGSFSSNSSQQVRLATLAPELASVTIAFNSSAVYIGQAVGTSVASVILARMSGPEAYAALGWGAASMTLLAMAVSWFASVRSRRPAGA